VTKLCVNCHNTQPVRNFYKDKSRKDGRHPYCKRCNRVQRQTPFRMEAQRIRQRGYYQTHKERFRAYYLKSRAKFAARKRSYMREYCRRENVRERKRLYHKSWRTSKPNLFLREWRANAQSRQRRMPDCYIIPLITAMGIDRGLITKDMIEAKREIVFARRVKRILGRQIWTGMKIQRQ
jgi:hypothetical protein